jgi:hypothetical protein
MNRQEFYQLSNTSIYEFVFYYGEKKVGILVESPRDKFYLVRPSDIKRFNDNPERLSDIGELVNIDTIKSHHVSLSAYTFSGGGESVNLNDLTEKLNVKKLIILGAGASYDFSFDTTLEKRDRPPLTYNLFDDHYDDILNNYPGARILASEILRSEDVEKYFQEQWDVIRNHYDPDLLSKLVNTQYYLQDLFNTISKKCNSNKRDNYVSLISRIAKYCTETKSKVFLISFNYDTLLEQAIGRVLDYQYKYTGDYIDLKNKILVFKPHGSHNWIRKLKYDFAPQDLRQDQLFSSALYNKRLDYIDLFRRIDDEIIISETPALTNNDSLNPLFYPQLLIPFTAKDEFVMPNSHTKILQSNLDEINEILVIGWKGTEDKFKNLILNEIGNRKIKVTVVNKGDDTIEQEFADIMLNADWVSKHTFSEYMEESIRLNSNLFS